MEGTPEDHLVQFPLLRANYSRFLRAVPSQVLLVSRVGDSMAFPGNLLQYGTSPKVKKKVYYASVEFLMFQFVLSVIPSDRTKRQSSLPPPPSLSCHRVIVHIGKISPVPFSRLNNPSSLSLSSHVRHPNLLLLMSLCWTCSSLSMFLCNVQPRTGHSTTDTVSPVLRKGEGSPPSSH